MGDSTMNILPGEITKILILTFVIGVIIALILGPITIPLLRRLKFGQNIREEGPKSHLKKAGTPTMGGVMFILSTTIVMFIMSDSFTEKGMVALYSLIAFGFIGFLDDLLKILKKQSEGLTAWQKMLLLLIISGAFGYYSYVNLPHDIVIPFTSFKLPLGMLYVPFVIFVYAAMTNAVNLTDGLDGLASTVSVLVLTFFGVLTFLIKDYSLTIFSVALIAGLIGFLKFNAYPAKVFMGDTGSLAIGGAITTIAIISGYPLLIVIVGGIYVLEALSVIIQVTSFKLTGKRVFKMAPIHHHFEQCGWNEVKVVTVFSIITVILCIIGFFAI
ncbi:phospho-N-acetylmuramoyl-pentapeptide-transferase [uncultured Clostridium sp.]|uniref:phospho-N-acetylmuramoyl-pentapeptide- transferase n=1 Tax=Clostridium sp. TaxID=1506 RepID=UPI0025F497AE|nr:phospho-N-acetylmuramoyl-pentapeptide-transferase [uncultured Clostridium sp.]